MGPIISLHGPLLRRSLLGFVCTKIIDIAAEEGDVRSRIDRTAIREKGDVDPDLLSKSRFFLAKALWETGRREVEDWLSSRTSP